MNVVQNTQEPQAMRFTLNRGHHYWNVPDDKFFHNAQVVEVKLLELKWHKVINAEHVKVEAFTATWPRLQGFSNMFDEVQYIGRIDIQGVHTTPIRFDPRKIKHVHVADWAHTLLESIELEVSVVPVRRIIGTGPIEFNRLKDY